MSSKYDKYTELRSGDSNIFGYGLLRRTSQLKKLFSYIVDADEAKKVCVLDFGCSDGHMIKQLHLSFGDKIDVMKGIDIFPHGKPDNINKQVEFVTIDLYHDMPFPFQDQSQDVLILSAFFKHHPHPVELLHECFRILKKGGCIIMLDPSKWVVEVGFLLKYFEPRYTTNPWSYKSVSAMISSSGLQDVMEIVLYEKYWIAPNSFLYKYGFERIMPNKIVQIFGLHQSMIIKKL